MTTPVLALNALPIVFTGQGCNAFVFSYSEQKLEQLRAALPRTARCFRDGESIYGWSHDADVPNALKEGSHFSLPLRSIRGSSAGWWMPRSNDASNRWNLGGAGGGVDAT